ncbi:MAG: hypothetical protein Kapaf2KO_18160 [Candidatus Kapaibacteriales bacterium]
MNKKFGLLKKKRTEPDFIGGQGSLTEKEERELKEYFAKKRSKPTRRISKKSNATANEDTPMS